MSQIPQHIAAEYQAAKSVIAKTLSDLTPQLAPSRCEAIAEAIIARLASHDPPILLEMDRGETP